METRENKVEIKLTRVMYIGDKEELFGQTALSQEIDSRFIVQFDNLESPESRGWHEYDKKDFISIKDLKEIIKK